MSTAAVSSSSIYQQMQTYFHPRSSDLQKLSQALQAGDLTGAPQEYHVLQALGQALQSGDLAGAQPAFAQLKSTFGHGHAQPCRFELGRTGDPGTLERTARAGTPPGPLQPDPESS